jgi:putative ABC transport system substrate-binding protein
MKRRDILALLAGLAVARPVVAHAQQPAQRTARIGYLSPGPRDFENVRAFFGELSRLGFSEGQNLTVVFESFGENPGALPAMAAEMVRAKVDLIVADGPEAPLRAARAATNAIPIVIVAVNYDPLERGYVANLARPGRNVTGLFLRSIELVGKQLEFLKAMAPDATDVTVLSTAETEDEFDAVAAGAKTLGLGIRSIKLGDPPYDFEAVFQKLAETAPKIVMILSSPAFIPYRERVATLSVQYRLPAMFRFRSYAEAGGLISYGVDSLAIRRRAAAYVAKILQGAKPADLPVERSDKFELVINMKTANALGLTMSRSLLIRADEVIE